MTCTACGSPLAPGAQVCASCGTPVTAPQPVQSKEQPSTVPSLPAANRDPPTSVSARLRPVSGEEKTINAVNILDVLVGRYRLEEKVGEGGMGAVYVAHDQELDRKVAVKLLAASLVNDAEVLERFEREARLTAKLDHPHIVPIYDVGRHEGRPFIVMKLLQGDSLAGRLRAKGGFTADETVKLMRQLASGLDFIHAQGFIHRDIKAGNIFVSPEGHATILDFGILRQKSATTGITRTGMVMGTPHYMAPEQALGLKDVDHRVDLYALAVVLFECLTGTLPFEADSELRLIQLQAHAPPPEILDRAPWIPPPVAAVVKKALAKKPDERFNTADALVKALENAYLEAKSSKPNLPVVPGPPPVVATTTAPSLRKIASSPPEVLPVVPGVVVPDTGELTRAVQTSRRGVLIGGVAVALALAIGGYFYFREGPTRVADVVDAGVAPLVALPEDAGGELLAETDSGAGSDFVDFPEPTDAGGAALIALTEDAGSEDVDDDDAGSLTRRPPKKKGKLNVISTHDGEPYWAQVTIDGTPRGRTPLLLDLPAGKYQVRVERSGFKPQERVVRVASGKNVVVKLELVQN
ncbi:MAG: protein kinase [Archangium sp.]|nr:protein kinase [Archangium sp.]